jgi:formate/nitrite transporter FocA (FNT family)
MKYLSVLIKGILAGICISIGGFLCLKVNIAANSKVLGAFLFPIGLILICNFGYFLYTGKICYLFENKEQSYKEKILSLILLTTQYALHFLEVVCPSTPISVE